MILIKELQMKHIFETTVRGLVKYYSGYFSDATLIEDGNGNIRIKDSVAEEYLKIVSNTDTFVLSLFVTDTVIPDVTLIFCDGSISLLKSGQDELHAVSIGGYWSVRDVLITIGEILKTFHSSNKVFDALLSLADTVALEVSSTILGIVDELSNRPHGDGEDAFLCGVINAVVGQPNQSTHTLKIMGGDTEGVFTLEFGVGIYLIDKPVAVNQQLSSNNPDAIEPTGDIYKDIKHVLVAVIRNSIIQNQPNNADVNFKDATLRDLVDALSDNAHVTGTDVSKHSCNTSNDETIVKEFAELVLATERYDLAMYLKHQGSHEAVLFSKVNGDELPLFRLSIQDGVVVTKFDIPSLKLQATVYMVPGYKGTILDMVTVVLCDEIMYKRGVIAIHGINYDITGIMNAANVALSHAVGAQYGRLDSVLPNLDPILTTLVDDLHLNSKLIYSVT